MGLILTEEWLLAQNRVLGAALLDPKLVPKVVTELTPEDFTGNARLIYDAMASCFRRCSNPDEIDPVVIVQTMGGSDAARTLVAQYMDLCPSAAEIDRYLQLTAQQSKLNRLRDLGQRLSETSSLEDAVAMADAITNQLVDRPGIQSFSPAALMEQFAVRHSASKRFAQWSIPVIGDYVRLKPGRLYIIGAEPSGGKTAFALEQMLSISADKRVLFCSLETDAGTLFDRMIATVAEIPLTAMERGEISAPQSQRLMDCSAHICSRNFVIQQCAGVTVAGIKAAAAATKADVVIVDYLQLICSSSRKLSRYEAVTEISMDLHILAQSTGIAVIALSQVTNRDPSARRAPLGIHSARESGQIEADADAILMVDKYVEPDLRKSGSNANRVLRIVKNKNGLCGDIPLRFDGRYQRFSRAYVPNPDWASAQKAKDAQKIKKQTSAPGEDFELISLDEAVPF